MRHHSGNQQRNAQPQYHGPRGAHGKQNAVRRCVSVAACRLVFAHHGSPFCNLSAQKVDDGKNHHPHRVNKVPVERERLKLLCVLFSSPARARENEHQRKHHQSHQNVRRVQSHQRVEGCAEEIGLDGQAFVVNKVVPFAPGRDKERLFPAAPWLPVRGVQWRRFPLRSAHGEVNGNAARKQANGTEDRHLQHFAGVGPVRLLPR